MKTMHQKRILKEKYLQNLILSKLITCIKNLGEKKD